MASSISFWVHCPSSFRKAYVLKLYPFFLADVLTEERNISGPVKRELNVATAQTKKATKKLYIPVCDSTAVHQKLYGTNFSTSIR